MSLHVGHLTSLYRYPVKSMLGESLPTAEVDHHGLPGDRGLAFLDEETGKVVSAKYPARWRAMLSARARLNGEPRITLPDGQTIAASDPDLDAVISALVGRRVRATTVRRTGDTVDRAIPEQVIAQGADVDVDATELELAEKSPTEHFVDYASLHVITKATLAAAGGAGGQTTPVAAERYRPNLVIDSGEVSGFIENEWVGRRLRVGPEVELAVILPTPRCAIPTLAHGDLPVDRAAVRNLLESNRIPVEGFGVLPAAGVYAHVITPGRITLRDEVLLVG